MKKGIFVVLFAWSLQLLSSDVFDPGARFLEACCQQNNAVAQQLFAEAQNRQDRRILIDPVVQRASDLIDNHETGEAVRIMEVALEVAGDDWPYT